MAWEPDRTYNFFFSPPAHLCAVTYMTEISLIVTLNNQFNSTQLQNRLMDFDETWYGWSIHGPLQVLLFFGQIRPGADPGWAKIGHGGPLLQETSSSDRKDTATNQMHSNDQEACGMKCFYFWFHSKVKFLTRFWRLFWLSFCLIFMQILKILCFKVFNLQLYCVIFMFVSGRMLIQKI